MKDCTICKINQPLANFSKCKGNLDGLQYRCKKCTTIYKKAWHKKNSNKISKIGANYYINNKEHINKRNSKWQKDNKGAVNALTAKSRASKLQATPEWLSKSQYKYMRDMYSEGSKLGMHVDRIVPLQGKYVSGLHVPWNLQLLSPEDNQRKSNKF